MTRLPKVANLLGYSIFFWSNEGNEPAHVHVCKGKAHASATKIWLGEVPHVAHNKSNIPQKDLNLILSWLTVHRDRVLKKWQEFKSA